MPIYEYECSGCGLRFDRRVTMQAPEPACPTCGAEDVRRLISVFAATGTATEAPRAATAGPPAGGCCGGACACGAR